MWTLAKAEAELQDLLGQAVESKDQASIQTICAELNKIMLENSVRRGKRVYDMSNTVVKGLRDAEIIA